MLKKSENNGTNEIGLATPTPEAHIVGITTYKTSILWNPV